MKGINFTIIFIIAVFVIGGIAIYAYEHFRYSPYALQVDLGVVIEWLRDRHVDLVDAKLIYELNNTKLLIDKRQTPYEFALSVYPLLSIFKDNTTRLEIPLKSTDKVLPLRFKYVDGKVVVSMSKCEIPVGSTILSINGYPIEDILEKYKNLYPTCENFQQVYSFVDKLLPHYPKIIDASTLQIKYQLPNSSAQRTSYIKTISFKDFQKDMHLTPVELYNLGQYTVVKINTFNISKKEDMKVVEDVFQKLSNKNGSIIFDLRYASDGDATIFSAIISRLIDEPTYLYPKLITRYRYRQVEKKQIPIEPDSARISKDVYFIVDSSCFYTPHKILLSFVSTNKIGKVLTTENETSTLFSDLSFYTDEFWKILPNTRAYIVMPLSKVIVENNLEEDQIQIVNLTFNESLLFDKTAYEDWLKEFISRIK